MDQSYVNSETRLSRDFSYYDQAALNWIHISLVPEECTAAQIPKPTYLNPRNNSPSRLQGTHDNMMISNPLKVAAHLQPYQVAPEIFVTKGGTNKILLSHLVVSAAVIHSNHVLLLQRAAHDWRPLLWELPGGRCEPGDESIIVSAVRELQEESGLVANEVVDVVGNYEWLDRGEIWRKVTFLMDIEPDDQRDGLPEIKIDPKEQASFVWATREEVVANKSGSISLGWTSEEQKRMVLEAFEVALRKDLTSKVDGK